MTTPAHLGGHYGVTNTAPLVLDYICARHAPIATMLDVGCGPGGMLDVAAARGIDAWGIDGDPALRHPRIVRHDYTTGPILTIHDDRLGWSFGTDSVAVVSAGQPSAVPTIDLAWCVEFAEHVAEPYLPNVLTTLRCCRVLLFSHALPGQGGHHHVLEREPDWWRDRLMSDGWTEDGDGSQWLRWRADDPYIKRTGMLWTRSV